MLDVSLQTDRGRKPVQGTHLCFTHLVFLDNTSVYLGECAPAGMYSVETGGIQVGVFKGCPSSIVFEAPAVKDKDKDGRKVVGSCHDIPIELSNKALRILFIGLCVVVFGGLFIFGVLKIFNQTDSSNEAIIQPLK